MRNRKKLKLKMLMGIEQNLKEVNRNGKKQTKRGRKAMKINLNGSVNQKNKCKVKEDQK